MGAELVAQKGESVTEEGEAACGRKVGLVPGPLGCDFEHR